VHPPSTSVAAAAPAPPARARFPCGARDGLLTVASFRTWRGSQGPVAQDPAVLVGGHGPDP